MSLSEVLSNHKNMEILLTLSNLLVFVIAQPKTGYCFVQCSTKYTDIHVVCQRLHSCPKPRDCVQYDVDKSWREYMLHILNDNRNAAVNGSKKFTFENPGARNMHALSYDMELEYIATCFLNQCEIPLIRGCLDSERFPALEIYNGVRNLELGYELWEYIKMDQYARYVDFNAQTDNAIRYKPEIYGWSVFYFWEAEYVGCAAAKKQEWGWILCILGPVYLYQEGTVYVYRVAKDPGEIASECEEGRNGRYPALCGNIAEVPAGQMWSNIDISFRASGNFFVILV